MKTIAFYFLPAGAAKPEPAHKPVTSMTGKFLGHVRSVILPHGASLYEASVKALKGEIFLNTVEVE